LLYAHGTALKSFEILPNVFNYLIAKLTEI